MISPKLSLFVALTATAAVYCQIDFGEVVIVEQMPTVMVPLYPPAQPTSEHSICHAHINGKLEEGAPRWSAELEVKDKAGMQMAACFKIHPEEMSPLPHPLVENEPAHDHELEGEGAHDHAHESAHDHELEGEGAPEEDILAPEAFLEDDGSMIPEHMITPELYVVDENGRRVGEFYECSAPEAEFPPTGKMGDVRLEGPGNYFFEFQGPPFTNFTITTQCSTCGDAPYDFLTRTCAVCNDGILSAGPSMEVCDFSATPKIHPGHDLLTCAEYLAVRDDYYIQNGVQDIGPFNPDDGEVIGEVGCATCFKFDYSGCQQCGNYMVEGSEQCDGTSFVTKCEDYPGFYAGELSCNDNCTVNTEACGFCGNGDVEEGFEECDDASWVDQACSEWNPELFGEQIGGIVTCKGCKHDSSQCGHCGDGFLTSNETCEPGHEITQTCAEHDVRFEADVGTLKCNSATCEFDTTECVAAQCVCSLDKPLEKKCTDFEEFASGGGDLKCDGCQYDTSGCSDSIGQIVNDVTAGIDMWVWIVIVVAILLTLLIIGGCCYVKKKRGQSSSTGTAKF